MLLDTDVLMSNFIKLSMRELATELGDECKACKIMEYLRQEFHEVRRQLTAGETQTWNWQPRHMPCRPAPRGGHQTRSVETSCGAESGPPRSKSEGFL